MDITGTENDRTFIVMWDMTGLESVIDLTDMLEESTMLMLKGEKSSSVGQLLHKMTLRARFNPQRHYEIYFVKTTSDMTEQQLVELFQEDPQAGADLIRDAGVKIYSDRIKDKVQVIT